ncbi:MAG: radical SAM protein [Geobacteraceae bacterium]|nr:radical SAM protein [Geobacteraceae bacterium]
MTSSEPSYQLNQAGLRFPEMLTFSITGSCNLTCSHCWVRAGEGSSPGNVPLGTVRRIMADFAAIGGEGIRITGGEPLCHPHWLEILQFSVSLCFKKVILQTNAMLMNSEQIDSLHKLDFPGLTLQISLDGVSPLTHDPVRGEGAFSGALQGIEMLVQAGLGPRIAIFCTEMGHNLEEIPPLLDFADRMGIGSVSTGAIVMCGRATESALVAPPALEQYLRLLERYDEDAHFRDVYARLGTVAALEWYNGESIRVECCSFIENPYLTPQGRLYPCLMCHADEYSVVRVFEKGLLLAIAEGVPLWSSLQRLSHCRSDQVTECRYCPLKACCGGGCMGRARGSFGDFMVADDRCTLRKAIYQHKLSRLH